MFSFAVIESQGIRPSNQIAVAFTTARLLSSPAVASRCASYCRASLLSSVSAMYRLALVYAFCAWAVVIISLMAVLLFLQPQRVTA